jgi:fatty acid desaturase
MPTSCFDHVPWSRAAFDFCQRYVVFMMLHGAEINELRTELRSRGLFEPRAVSTSIKLLSMLAAFAALSAAVILLPAWCAVFLVPLAAVPAVTAAMVGHEAAHGSFARSKAVNELMLHLLFPLFSGLGALHWKNKHNRLHHGAPNVVDKDQDIELWPMTLSCIEYRRSGRFRRWLQRELQGYLFWPLTMALAFTMRAASLRHLVTHARTHGIDRAWLADASCLLGHYVLWLVVPAFWFGALPVVLFYVGLWTVGGALLALIFAPAHMGMPIVTEAETKANVWRHQLETTRNFMLPRWISWFFVGLDFQVEHHLFPRMPHQQLRRASPVVRSWCARVGTPYQELGYGAAVIDVTRFMAAAWQYEPCEQGTPRPSPADESQSLVMAGGLV